MLLAVAAVATPTWAVDLTGTWTGQQRCKFFDGVQTKKTFGLTNQVKITQTATRLAVETPGGIGTFYNGEVLDDASKSSKGRAVFAECRSTTELDGYSELVHLKAAGSESSGRLRGESVFRSQRGEVGTCKWNLKRSSTDDPEVTGCTCCK